MSNPLLERLQRAHLAYATKHEYDVEPPPVVTDAQFEALEALAGMKVPALA